MKPEFFSDIFEHMSEGFIIIDQSSMCTYANRTALTLLRLGQSDMLVGKPIDAVFQQIPEHPIYALAKKNLQAQEIVETEVYFEPWKQHLQLRSYSRDDETIIFFTELPQRQMPEEMIIESERRYRTLFENMNAGFVLFEVVQDDEGAPVDLIIRAANKGFEQTTGLIADEVIDKRLTQVLPGIENDEADWIGTYGKVALTGESLQFEQISELLGYHYSITAFPSLPNQCAVTFVDISEYKQAQKDVEMSERRFRTLIEKNLDLIVLLDKNFKPIYVSPSIVDMLGYTSDEFLQKWHENMVHPDDIHHRINRYKRLLDHPEETITSEIRIQHKDGTWRVLRWLARNLLNDPSINAIVSNLSDITDKKKTEEELRVSERLFSDAFHVGPAGMTITRIADGKFIDANESFCAMFEYERDEVIGHTSVELNMWTASERQRIIEQQRETGGLTNFELVAQSKSGKSINVLFSSREIFINDELCHLTTLIDISERKLAEEALRKSEEKYRMLIEHASDGIFVSDSHAYVVDVNAHGCNLLGYAREELIGKHLSELVAPANLQAQPLMVDELKVGETLFTERRLNHKTGTHIPVEISSTLLPDRGILGIVRDIRERKNTEQVLLRYNRRLAVLREIDKDIISARSAKDIVNAVFNSLGDLVAFDRVVAVLVERKTDEMIIFSTLANTKAPLADGQRLPLPHFHKGDVMDQDQSVFVPDIREIPILDAQVLQQLIQEGQRSSISIPMWVQDLRIGSLNLFSKTLNYFTQEHEEILRDISNQIAIAIHQSFLHEQIEQANVELENRVIERTAKLQHSEERYRGIIDSQTDLVCRYKSGGVLTFVNQTYCKHYNQPPEQLLGKSRFDLVPHEESARLERHIAALNSQNPTANIEIQHVTHDGQPRWLSWHDCALFDKNGDFIEYQSVGRDITDRKQSQIQLQQMLEHAMKMSELRSRYVAMAAHDLRNPLAIIQTSIYSIQQYQDKMSPEKLESKYQQIQSSIEIMIDMLDDLLTIGKIESGRIEFSPSRTNLNSFCKMIIEEVKFARNSSQHIAVSSQGSCNNMMVDNKLMRHILTNLLSNAIKYSSDNTSVELSLKCEPDVITIEVTDHGIGIPQDDQNYLFEAFHRASNAHEISGNGLGLAIVKQSVDLHGGTIFVTSEENVGTTFTVTIPQN